MSVSSEHVTLVFKSGTEQAEESTVEIVIRGTLTADDYHVFLPEIENLIKQHGKLRMLVVLQDFHGWTAAALWEDIKFDMHHYSDISRLALVGDSKWEEGMAAFCKPFTSAKIKYFDHQDLAAARSWLAAVEA